MTAVLDSSAFLAFLFKEPGCAEVSRLLEAGAYISSVNLAESLSKISDRGTGPSVGFDRLAATGLLDEGLVVVPFDLKQSLHSADLRPATREKGLSLGDRACLALAATAGLPVYTADTGWQGLDIGIDIRFVR